MAANRAAAAAPHETGGRPAKPHRPMVEAMIWVLRTGAPWRELPPAYGPWKSVYTRFSRWPKDRARFYEYSRGSAMECGALFDALRAMDLVDEPTHAEAKELLVRIVSMLSKMC
ncbi:MAG TPA: transposase [Sandaracinaceae bacterium LLY-WYZ-13_1]|nr:transposase [Sandaracinaceae bacterium LLY-WYZ-13_1]